MARASTPLLVVHDVSEGSDSTGNLKFSELISGFRSDSSIALVLFDIGFTRLVSLAFTTTGLAAVVGDRRWVIDLK